MTIHHNPENWETLGRMYDAVATLKDKLEAKGFSVIATISVGIYPATLTFIVERNYNKILSFVCFDILGEEDRVKNEVFAKGEELLSTDFEALEREYLLNRLAELDNLKRPGNAGR